MNMLSLNLWFSIALFLSATTVRVCSGCVEEERNGLLKLNPLFRIIPISWVDDEDSDCCGWERVLCDNNAPRRVIRLDLNKTGAGSYYDRVVLDASLFLPFQQLQHLNLSDNWIFDLQNGHDLGKLKRLEVLILTYNNFDNITRIFRSLSAITSFTVLDLKYNNLYNHPGVILDASLLLPFQRLQHLDLSGNSISDLQNSHDLGKLKRLEVLILAYNKFDNITRIFRSLSAVTSLTVLDLSYNTFYNDHLDASLFLPFQQLHHLDLSGNYISDLQNGHELGKLKKLEELALKKNKFNNTRILLQSLSPLTSLTVLDLSSIDVWRNKSTPLDASLFLPFQQLQYLDLSWNYFSDLQNHQDLGKLKKLDVLILRRNLFSTTRIFQSLSALTSLTVLDLSYNEINGTLFDYDRELCKLKNLRELSLARNMLSGSIPECFKHLTSLKSLDLSSNELFGNLHPFPLSTSVKYLFLGDNQFDANLTFNSFVDHGFQFRYLDLSNCNLNISTTDLVKFLSNHPILVALHLSNNNLQGEFSNSSFKNNLELKRLDLKNNSLTGRIQFPIGPLLNLEFFDVSYNHIQGKLQSNIGQVFPKLQDFRVANNELGGEIPTSLGKMKDLIILDLTNNKLSGKFPVELGLSCPRIRSIRLSNNRLKGHIPDSLFNLTDLSNLDLSNNQFTGHIPSNNFQSFYLFTFNISKNHISGRIPVWLGSNMTIYLQTVAMQDNHIEGYIPTQLCNNTRLNYLSLSQNQLSGPIPSCLTTMPLLLYLHLQHNNLSGKIPTLKVSPLNNSTLLTLDLSYNNLSGKIPYWFGFLKGLRVLLLKGNRLSGSIPLELCRLHNLGIMDLSHNNLSGSIPLCFTSIPFGKGLLDDSGYFQYWADISSLDEIVIPDLIIQPFSQKPYLLQQFQEDVEFMMKSRSNSYKGDIIKYMYGMDLSCNNLNGNIPMDMGSLTEIRALNLSHNHFTGVIPSSLSNMKQIESMDFSHNKLSGQIPSNLTHLSFLVVFNVAYNNLSGRVPEMVAQFSTFGETSYGGNQFLCGPPLTKTCNTKEDPATTTSTSLAERIDMFGIDPINFFASFAAAYGTHLSAFVIILCINPHWRRRWFHFIDACLSFVFPFYAEAIHRRVI